MSPFQVWRSDIAFVVGCTFQNVRAMFYSPNIYLDVRQYVDRCLIYQQSKGNMQKVSMTDNTICKIPLRTCIHGPN